MSGKERDALNAWIEEMRAAGYWVTKCLSCGYFFAQKREHRGRRARACKLQRCDLWWAYERRNHLAPPPWLKMKWEAIYADRERTRAPKKHPEERRCA